jgi:hypothetical protein
MTTASDEREIFISRVLVLNLSGKKAVPGTAQDIFALDTAFILIEGHPQRWWCRQKHVNLGFPISSPNCDCETMTSNKRCPVHGCGSRLKSQW